MLGFCTLFIFEGIYTGASVNWREDDASYVEALLGSDGRGLSITLDVLEDQAMRWKMMLSAALIYAFAGSIVHAETWRAAQDTQGNWHILNGPAPWDQGQTPRGTAIPMADEKTAEKTADTLNDAIAEGEKRNEKKDKKK